jgi:hypothetical protein
MHRLKNRQLVIEAGDEGLTAAEPASPEPLPFHDRLGKIHDPTEMLSISATR